MKKFIAIHLGSASSARRSEWDRMEEGKRKKLEASGTQAWVEWMAVHG